MPIAHPLSAANGIVLLVLPPTPRLIAGQVVYIQVPDTRRVNLGGFLTTVQDPQASVRPERALLVHNCPPLLLP